MLSRDADAFFNEQMEKLKDLDDFENTEKTVAFFYLTADGKVVVRKSTLSPCLLSPVCSTSHTPLR